MREGTKKILLRQESLQKQKFFYKKNYFPAFLTKSTSFSKKGGRSQKIFDISANFNKKIRINYTVFIVLCMT